MERTVRQAAVDGVTGREVGALLRRLRQAGGFTQGELAHLVGYSRSQVANAEAGDVRAADFYRRCDAALAARGELRRAYRAYLTSRACQAHHDHRAAWGRSPGPARPALGTPQGSGDGRVPGVPRVRSAGAGRLWGRASDLVRNVVSGVSSGRSGGRRRSR